MKSCLGAGLIVAAMPLHLVCAQQVCPPAVQWQQSFGSCGGEFLRGLKSLPNGGYVFAGATVEFCDPTGIGNKTSPNYGNTDWWLVRTDDQGNKLWDASFGGSGEDGFDGTDIVQQTADGGFILGGWSDSPPSGTKTSPHYGSFDYWVVRVDRDGHQLWDRSFGGSGDDGMVTLQEVPGDGFILGGASSSPPSGNKTSPHYGYRDWWLVRLNAQGEKLWDRSYRGNTDDQLDGLCQTSDGGFVLVGTVTQIPGFTSQTRLLRLDSNGAVIWEKSLGDFLSYSIAGIRRAGDGGFVIGGVHEDPGKFSFALARVDAGGVVLWQKTYGGLVGADLLSHFEFTTDGGLVLGGRSYSWPGGDKTSAAYGEYDYWIVRVDANGNKLWDLSFGTSEEDELYGIQQTAEGGFIVGGSSSGHFWVIKLGPEDCDGDGVPDTRDLCPGTRVGAIVNEHGCSIDDLCPCDGPWRDREEYLRCVRETLMDFRRAGRISKEEAHAILNQAKRSDCGKRRHSFTPETDAKKG